ncbi:MAG: hypothetical protein IJ859_06200 [Synergistaceae bacterium]|nr:hypothetical protein [Synergistaceae bacterium]
MLTLNVPGKHGGELVNFLQSSLKDDETELKILIDGPVQVEEIRKILEPLGFANFVLEDDDGNLYITTSKNPSIASKNDIQAVNSAPANLGAVTHEPVAEAKPMPIPISKPVQAKFNLQKSTGVLISCENGKYRKIFTQKILSSLVKSKIKPEVLALMNAAVSLAAYNSKSCDYLKELEAAGVKILISESCADYLGITESIGAGTAVDMSEIFEEIFSCERIINF